jgi:redox-sensitive bicupin YhaK (pirin superfamily)
MTDILKPHAKDLGGFTVRRLLPAFGRQTVGPFIFFDHFGPVLHPPGANTDVRPHPHIGLATVTYLLEGAMVHRDSVGSHQVILPGDVNWMTAGRGIVHSERARAEDRAAGHRMHGLQTWIALPQAHEDTAPAFAHHAKASLPLIEAPGATLRLIAGTAFGERSPVDTFGPMFYVAATLDAGASLDLPAEHEERAIYVVGGDVAVDGIAVPPFHMAVLQASGTAHMAAASDATVMWLGGAALDGPRLIWWNFVASSKERIEDAKARWRDGAFPPIDGETEFIPLPER